MNTNLPKLGKTAAREYPATGLRLASYVSAKPTALPQSDWLAKLTTIPLYLNDQIGDCTDASLGHQVGVWTANALGTQVVLPDAAILKAYSAVSGYNPSTGANDNGCNMQDVLTYVRTFGLGGHKLINFMKVNLADANEVSLAIQWFGGLYLGVNLPIACQGKTGTWDRPKGALTGKNKPGSWGGHAICVPQYDPDGMTCLTWGNKQRFTWAWLDAYADEAYAILSLDWIFASKGAPNGLSLRSLITDMASFA